MRLPLVSRLVAATILVSLPVEAAVTITNVSASGCGTAALQVRDGSATADGSRFTGSGIGIIVGDLGSLAITGAIVTGNSTHGVQANGSFSAASSSVGGNGGDGILIETAGAVTLDGCEIHTNSGAGVRALRAQNLRMIASTATGTVHDNGGDGIILGDLTTQSGHVVAHIEAYEIHRNAVGIRAQQKDAASASTTSTILLNSIHDNRQSGMSIASSFLPRTPGGDAAIAANTIFHNGFTAGGCFGGTAPQIDFIGPVSVTSGQAAACSVSTAADCQAASGAGNPCFWDGFSCATAYDMRGPECGTGTPNSIYDYDTADSSLLTVAIFARNGANVDAGNTAFRTGNFGQDVDYDAISRIVAFPVCAPRPLCTSP